MTESPPAAPPLLGSTLLSIAEAHQKQRPPPASSGCPAIDQTALDGGFKYGEITSIAGAAGTGKTLLAYHAIVSHLIAHKAGEVAFIDTTGSFSPVRLRDVLAFRLRALYQGAKFVQSGYIHQKPPAEERVDNEEIMLEAVSMLNRVKMMRVFDLAGVAEAVGEVNDIVEQYSRVALQSEASAQKGRQLEIEDSEDELEGGHDDPLPTAAAFSPAENVRSVGMIAIDTITNVVSSMVAQSQTQGQALLASLMRSIHLLMSRHHICTILINSAVGMSTSSNAGYQQRPEDHVSVFASTLGKPALGKTFTYLIDTSIFLSNIPRARVDAEVLFGERKSVDSWKAATILEIVNDKNSDREGRWAAFEIVSNVKLAAC